MVVLVESFDGDAFIAAEGDAAVGKPGRREFGFYIV
jgi:hypothetical protein